MVLFRLELVLGLFAWVDCCVSCLIVFAKKMQLRLGEEFKANFRFSISQTIIILSGQQFDKKRITVKIRLVENMEI
jgi:hypothetical protein